MTNTLYRRRHLAFVSQCGHCYYCGLPIWESSPDEFAKQFGITTHQACRLQCTDTFKPGAMAAATLQQTSLPHAFIAIKLGIVCDPRQVTRNSVRW